MTVPRAPPVNATISSHGWADTSSCSSAGPATAARSWIVDPAIRGDNRVQRRYGGIGGSPCSSPPVMNTANSHGHAPLWPRRRTHARAAVASAWTASPSGEPAGMIAPCSASSACAQRTPEQRKSSARRLAARSHPRTVPGGRPSRAAIVRCPSPRAPCRSASPITSAPSHRRGTDHAGQSTCVDPQRPQHARRGRTERTPCSIRTSRARANPHGDSGPEQPGQASRPASSATSSASSLMLTDNTEQQLLADHHRSLPDRASAGKGRLVWEQLPDREHRRTPVPHHPTRPCRRSMTLTGPRVPKLSGA